MATYGLRIGFSGLPSWATGAASGTWVEVPVATTLEDIDPIDDPAINPNFPSTPEWAENTGRQSAIVYAWCGAAWDEATDRMWLGIGGGHADYAGNEVYKCAFGVAEPAWSMVRPPSGAVGNLLTTNDGQEASGVYSDGRPRATHTYNQWIYVPSVGPVLLIHGATSWSAGNGKQWPVIIDETDGEHTFGTDDSTQSLGDTSAGAAAYDSTRNVGYFKRKGTNDLRKYTPGTGNDWSAGTWSTLGSSFNVGAGCSLCYLPDDDCLLVMQSTGGPSIIDCATGTRYTPTFSGTASGGALGYQAQPRWVPALGAVCFWDNATSTTLITRLTPGADPRTDTWTIDALSVSGSNAVTPAARTTNGTFGRFAYSSTLGGFLVFSSTSGPTSFYKI